MGAYIVPIMGTTCAGKSTLINKARARNNPKIGLVEIGKILRAKYPPEFFKGQAAPAHTQEEAWNLCFDAVNKHLEVGCELILIDGQPRDLRQLATMMKDPWPGLYQVWYVLLHASMEERERRARQDRADTQGNLDLALARIKNDMVNYYDILVHLHFYDKPLTVYMTDHEQYTPDTVIDHFLALLSPDGGGVTSKL